MSRVSYPQARALLVNFLGLQNFIFIARCFKYIFDGHANTRSLQWDVFQAEAKEKAEVDRTNWDTIIENIDLFTEYTKEGLLSEEEFTAIKTKWLRLIKAPEGLTYKNETLKKIIREYRDKVAEEIKVEAKVTVADTRIEYTIEAYSYLATRLPLVKRWSVQM
eukprot:TRINITY_DN4328_c0_g2_i3.p2 TRINITY_DN4328_c0_g2~~TRINITY_DN4328_c0_g2_i3.p2  ORF type:complete len:163 (+),score=32.41 TRINITY_DN4328_c0_g2_i3:658-1146(+)